MAPEELPDGPGHGQVNTFAYDALNRLQTTSAFDGQTITYTYTASGQVQTVQDARGSVSYSYDYAAFGDLLQDIPDPLSSYLYTGQRFDAATDTYYLRAREYDPRFSASNSPARVAPSVQIAAQSACLRWSTLFAQTSTSSNSGILSLTVTFFPVSFPSISISAAVALAPRVIRTG